MNYLAAAYIGATFHNQIKNALIGTYNVVYNSFWITLEIEDSSFPELRYSLSRYIHQENTGIDMVNVIEIIRGKYEITAEGYTLYLEFLPTSIKCTVKNLADMSEQKIADILNNIYHKYI